MFSEPSPTLKHSGGPRLDHARPSQNVTHGHEHLTRFHSHPDKFTKPSMDFPLQFENTVEVHDTDTDETVVIGTPEYKVPGDHTSSWATATMSDSAMMFVSSSDITTTLAVTLTPPTALPSLSFVSTSPTDRNGAGLNDPTTLQTSTLPVPTLPTSALANVNTAQLRPSSTDSFTPEPSDYETPKCEGNEACLQQEEKDVLRRDHIAGIVVGSIAFFILLFGIWRFWKWSKKRKEDEAELERAAVRANINHGTSTGGSTTLVGNSKEKGSKEGLRMEVDDDGKWTRATVNAIGVALGEPGPTIGNDHLESHPWQINLQAQAPSACNQAPRHEYTISNSTTSNASSDPFCSPTDSYSYTYPRESFSTDNGTSTHSRPSRICVAITRYSTAETSPTTQSLPVSPTKPCALLPSLLTTHNNEGRDITQKRVSDFSVHSDNTATTINDDADKNETVYIGKARTYRMASMRRHSLTPRVINIVANSNGSNDRVSMINVGANTRNGSRSPQRETAEISKRDSVHSRARSSSPAKALAVSYSGSPAKLNKHFGITTSSMDEGRTSSERLQNSSSPSKSKVVGPHQSHVISNRKGKDKGHISCPPTSYPDLGRTMSEVKRNIRSRREKAFATPPGSDNSWSSNDSGLTIKLPDSVVIQRPGQGRRGRAETLGS